MGTDDAYLAPGTPGNQAIDEWYSWVGSNHRPPDPQSDTELMISKTYILSSCDFCNIVSKASRLALETGELVRARAGDDGSAAFHHAVSRAFTNNVSNRINFYEFVFASWFFLDAQQNFVSSNNLGVKEFMLMLYPTLS